MSDCVTPDCYDCCVRKARKVHKCCECRGTIQAGEDYNYHHGVWEGEAASYKVCLDCEVLRAEYDRDAQHDEGTPFQHLREAVEATRLDAPELFKQFLEIQRKRGAILAESSVKP